MKCREISPSNCRAKPLLKFTYFFIFALVFLWFESSFLISIKFLFASFLSINYCSEVNCSVIFYGFISFLVPLFVCFSWARFLLVWSFADIFLTAIIITSRNSRIWAPCSYFLHHYRYHYRRNNCNLLQQNKFLIFAAIIKLPSKLNHKWIMDNWCCVLQTVITIQQVDINRLYLTRLFHSATRQIQNHKSVCCLFFYLCLFSVWSKLHFFALI